MKAPSKNKIYGTITAISAVVGILGGAIQVYAYFQQQEEEERQRQEEEERRLLEEERRRLEEEKERQRQEEEARKSQTDRLREQIEHAKSVVSDCRIFYDDASEVNLEHVQRVLNRAENELKLRGNLSGAQALYDSVVDDVIRCQPQPSPPIEEPPVITPPSEVATAPQFTTLPITIIISFIIAGVFGFLWYRNSRKQNQQ